MDPALTIVPRVHILFLDKLTPMRRLSLALFALLSISFTTIFYSTIASAHSGVVSSNPSVGQVLAELPNEISVTFSEELLVIADKAINTLTLNNVDGTKVPLTDIKVEGNILIATVPSGEYPAGLYEMVYRVISADGHEITAVIGFSIDTLIASPASSAPPEVIKSLSDSSSISVPIALVIALVIALLIATGGFFLLKRRRRAN